MNENLQATPLAPNSYPLWIKLFGICVLINTVYCLSLTPRYFKAGRLAHQAKQAYRQKHYDTARELYEKLLDIIPTSKKAHIGAAEAIFADSDSENDLAGLNHLEGITLIDREWKQVQKIMPPEYQSYFKLQKE